MLAVVVASKPAAFGKRMFTDLKREHQIRCTLRKLSRQRVVVVLQPGNIWVIEKAVEDSPDTDVALKTCEMRGWIEPLEAAIPTGKLTPDGKLPTNFKFEGTGTLYKLTSAGWSVIFRSYQIAEVALAIAAVSLLVSIVNS